MNARTLIEAAGTDGGANLPGGIAVRWHVRPYPDEVAGWITVLNDRGRWSEVYRCATGKADAPCDPAKVQREVVKKIRAMQERLDELLLSNALTPADEEALGKLVAAFHAAVVDPRLRRPHRRSGR